MCNIIGQKKLITKLNTFSLDTLPKTILFIGPKGCGKKTIAKYLATRLQLDFKDITDVKNGTDLDEYLFSTINTLYLITLDELAEKQQNVFLKFIEEPSKPVFLLLTAQSESGILPTVLNRCTKFYFEEYSKQELQQITQTTLTDAMYNMFKTPGKLKHITSANFDYLLSFTQNIFNSISTIKYSDLLSLSLLINYKDLYDKVDFELFLDALEFTFYNDYKISGKTSSLTGYLTTNRFKKIATKQSLIKETLMLNFLTTLWEVFN